MPLDPVSIAALLLSMDWENPLRLRSHPPVAIVLHHTQTRPDAPLSAIRKDHQGRGWGLEGYHWWVKNGRPIPGRPEKFAGVHAPGWNPCSIAIALVGDHRAREHGGAGFPPDYQLNACLGLVIEIRSRYGPIRILDHKEAMAEVGLPDHTDCAGVDWVDWIRARLPIEGPG